jgi:hypothetical protein
MSQKGPKQAKRDHGQGGVSNNAKTLDCKDLWLIVLLFAQNSVESRQKRGDMKPILFAVCLIVFAGCQDLSDYPGTPKTQAQNGADSKETSTRPANSVPQGCRTILSERDLQCFAGVPVEFRIQITPPPGEFCGWSPAPAGMYFDSYRQYNTTKDGWFIILSGSPKNAGKYQISVDLSNASGTSRSWFTLTVFDAPRQSVEQ